MDRRDVINKEQIMDTYTGRNQYASEFALEIIYRQCENEKWSGYCEVGGNKDMLKT